MQIKNNAWHAFLAGAQIYADNESILALSHPCIAESL